MPKRKHPEDGLLRMSAFVLWYSVDNGFLFVSVLREIIEEKSHGGALCQEKANRNGTICSWRLPALASPSAGSAKSAAFPKTCSTGKPPVLATLPADAVHLCFLLRQ